MKFCNSPALQISKSGKSLKIKFTILYDRESSLISDPSCPFDPVINTLILYVEKVFQIQKKMEVLNLSLKPKFHFHL